MTAGRPTFTPRGFAGYRPGWIGPDMLAGLTLAAIVIPTQMATARLAGLPPQIGFYAFLAATAGFALLGSSRVLSCGADSTIAPIFAGVLASLAAVGSPHYAALAAGLALITGVLVALAGVCRLGWIGDLVSVPVMAGFMAGIALHILASQLPAALGVADPGGDVLPRLLATVRAAPRANLFSAAIAGGVLAVTLVCERLSRRAPGALLALVLATAATSLLHLDRRGVARLGAVAAGLPRPVLPALTAHDWSRLAPLAVLVALVIMVQTAAVGRAFASAGGEADADGDFRGMGAANLLAGLFGAFPVDASPPSTAVASEAGARSQVACLAAGACVALVLLVGAPLLAAAPTAALAGVLVFVALRLVRLDDMIAIVRRSRIEIALTAATAAAIVLLPIDEGVGLGVLLSILQGVWTGTRVRVQPMSRIPSTSVWWPSASPRVADGETVAGVAVLAFPAPLTFLDATSFARDFLAAARGARPEAKLVVLEAAGLTLVDFTAAQAIARVVAACRADGRVFAVARLESLAAQKAFDRLGLTDLIGADHVFGSVADAIAALGPGQAPSAAL